MNLYNRTHVGAMILIMNLFGPSTLKFVFSMPILWFFEAKVPMIIAFFSAAVFTWSNNKHKVKWSVLILIIAFSATYSKASHWLNYDISQIWAIQNRINSYAFLLEELQHLKLALFFPQDPAKMSPKAFDSGVVVGILRLGIPLFFVY